MRGIRIMASLVLAVCTVMLSWHAIAAPPNPVTSNDTLFNEAETFNASEYSFVHVGGSISDGWLVSVRNGNLEAPAYELGDLLVPGIYYNLSGFNVTLEWGDGTTVSFPDRAIFEVQNRPVSRDDKGTGNLPGRSAHCRDGFSCCANDADPTARPPTRASARCIRDTEWNHNPSPSCQYGGLGTDQCAAGGPQN